MWIWLLLMTLVALIALGVAILAVVNVNRAAHRTQQTEQRLERKIDQLEGELSAMMDGAFGVANSLQEMEMSLKDTTQRQQQLQQRDLGNLPYNEAVRLASKGASADDLVEHCGLSRSEAELVELLHKKSSMTESGSSTPKADERPFVSGRRATGGHHSNNVSSSDLNAPEQSTAQSISPEQLIDPLKPSPYHD